MIYFIEKGDMSRYNIFEQELTVEKGKWRYIFQIDGAL